VRRYAIGYPAVRFSLVLDEHTVLQTSGSGDLAMTLIEMYQLPMQEMLQVVDASDGQHYTVHGYIGNRVLAQRGRQYITFFINGRTVQSRPLTEALEQGYRSLLPKGKHPLLALSLGVPPAEVDVNVHPAKTEVHLQYEDVIFPALTKAVAAVFERSPAVPEKMSFPGPLLAVQRRFPGPRRRGLHIAESAEEYRFEAAGPDTAEAIAGLRPLAQLQQALILAEAADGSLYLIDQHRAHERVIYEHLRRSYAGIGEEEAVNAHLLLEPVLIEMKRYEAELLEQRLPVLRSLGIECERFGGRSFLVRSIPVGEGNEQMVSYLQELVEIAAEDNTDWEDHFLIGMACRSALRRGRELASGEQRILLRALAQASVPAVCPHGSPILLHYSRSFLIERFNW
jgi:DNA mismatch repair protein MutL